ncbi:MAG TPA: copper oxidase [Candidatus Dormibacteraeota bacterium]
MSVPGALRPRNTREAMLSISLIILVPVALLLGVVGGQHLPPLSSATAISTSPSPQTSGMAGMPGMASNPSGPTSDQMDGMMTASIKAFPAKTAGLGGQVMQPSVQGDGTKQYELTAAITPWEVSPGHVVQAWTYNGVVPGPTIHVNVGDKVRVILHNKLPESTVIHFHGLIVPNAMDGVPDITQPPVKPGQSFTYEFTAQGPAVGMYHSHDDSAKQVTSGLAGAFLVGEEPLPNSVQAAQEFPMVLNDAGPIGLSLNGKSFPATAPIVAKLGDWILVHYFNEGFQIHPMHLHGIPGMVVAKDGFALASPYMADTVLVAPGERYSVLIHADQPGTWAWHCHILTHAENASGMFGMVTALVVK